MLQNSFIGRLRTTFAGCHAKSSADLADRSTSEYPRISGVLFPDRNRIRTSSPGANRSSSRLAPGRNDAITVLPAPSSTSHNLMPRGSMADAMNSALPFQSLAIRNPDSRDEICHYWAGKSLASYRAGLWLVGAFVNTRVISGRLEPVTNQHDCRASLQRT